MLTYVHIPITLNLIYYNILMLFISLFLDCGGKVMNFHLKVITNIKNYNYNE